MVVLAKIFIRETHVLTLTKVQGCFVGEQNHGEIKSIKKNKWQACC